MATRYSGECTIRMSYRDQYSDYRCVVRWPDGRRVVYVGEKLQHGSGIGVDHPQMYDEVASAALFFTMAGDEDHDEDPVPDLPGASNVDGSGWHVGRKLADAWPREEG